MSSLPSDEPPVCQPAGSVFSASPCLYAVLSFSPSKMDGPSGVSQSEALAPSTQVLPSISKPSTLPRPGLVVSCGPQRVRAACAAVSCASWAANDCLLVNATFPTEVAFDAAPAVALAGFLAGALAA